MIFLAILAFIHIGDGSNTMSNIYRRTDSLPVSSDNLLIISIKYTTLIGRCLHYCQEVGCDVAHYERRTCSLYESLEMIPQPTDANSKNGKYYIRDHHLPLEQKPENYRVYHGYHLGEGITNAPNTVEVEGITTVHDCVKKCEEEFGADCNMFSVRKDSKVCLMTSKDFYTTWTVFEKRNRTISYFKYRPDGYKMLYRRPKALHLSGFDRQVTDPWEDDSYAHTYFDSESSVGPTLNTVRVVAKNTMANYWDLLSVNRIRMGMYQGGEEKRYIEFDGTGSDRTNWVQLDKLVDSPWTDFSVGKTVLHCVFESGVNNRGLYMVKSHGGCPSDYLWFVAIDRPTPTGCEWERLAWNDTTTPQMLYASGNSATNANQAAAADLLMISVTLN